MDSLCGGCASWIFLVLSLWCHTLLVEGKNKEYGHWGEWGSWSPCSSTCGAGVMKLEREWIPPAGEAKPDKPYTSSRVFSCTNQQLPNCPVDGEWSGWTSWSACTKPCGQGTKNRTRACGGRRYNGKPCEGKDEMTAPCKRDPCPVIPRGFQMSECTEKNFTCASKKMCIQSNQKCDETVQCHDGSDEIGCPRRRRTGRVKYDLGRGSAFTFDQGQIFKVLTSLTVFLQILVHFKNRLL